MAKDCKFNPPTNGKKGFHYVIENGRPHLLARKDLKDLTKTSIVFKLPSEDGSRKLRMKAQSELVQGLASGVLPMSWELRPRGDRVALQWATIQTYLTILDKETLVLDTFDDSGFNLWTNTKYDVEGFNKDGFNKDGFDRFGFDRTRQLGRTGTYLDFYDFDDDGYNEYGYDRDGLDRTGLIKADPSRMSYDPRFLVDLQHQGRFVALDAAGRDPRGFNAFGVNSPVDELWPGEKRGFSRNGQFGSASPIIDASLMLAHDDNGFDAYGIHRESRSWLVKRTSLDRGDVWVDAWGRTWASDTTPRDERGFDIQGTLANGSRVDSRGFNAFGVHEVTRTLANKRGFDHDGIHFETGTKYDIDGFDAAGFNKSGYDRQGRDEDGCS